MEQKTNLKKRSKEIIRMYRQTKDYVPSRVGIAYLCRKRVKATNVGHIIKRALQKRKLKKVKERNTIAN
jgi:hypothetical protein